MEIQSSFIVQVFAFSLAFMHVSPTIEANPFSNRHFLIWKTVYYNKKNENFLPRLKEYIQESTFEVQIVWLKIIR